MNGLVHGFSPTLGVISDRFFFGLLGEAVLGLIVMVFIAMAIAIVEYSRGKTIGGALLSDSNGQGLLEYAIILVLAAIVTIAALLLFRPPERLLSVARVVYDNWPLATFIGIVIILCVGVVALKERKREEEENELGQGFIEYALILVLVLVVVTAILMLIKPQLDLFVLTLASNASTPVVVVLATIVAGIGTIIALAYGFKKH